MPGRFMSCLVVVLVSVPALAETLRLEGKMKWLKVATSPDFDEAVGTAWLYPQNMTRVVKARDGTFVVALGPVQGENIASIQQDDPTIGDVPGNAVLERGEDYLETVWDQRKIKSVVFSTYGTKTPATFSHGSMTFEVSMQGDEDNPSATLASGKHGGAPLFNFATPADFSVFASEAGLVKLDPQTSAPQLVFTRFTGGAHCCTQTWIATSPQGAQGWTLIDAGMRDGGGYVFEDLDGDGALELRGVDNSFLYAFDSYAASLAPMRIYQLRGGVLQDVSSEPQFRFMLKRDLARMQHLATLDPSSWKSNGFLVGWLAAKMRLGQGDEGWRVFEENVDTKSDFGPVVCKTGEALENCPAENLVPVPLLQAVAEFFRERDYGPLPAAAQRYLKN